MKKKTMNRITKFINYLIGKNKIDNISNESETTLISKEEDPEELEVRKSGFLQDLKRVGWGKHFYAITKREDGKTIVFYINIGYEIDNKVKMIEVLQRSGLLVYPTELISYRDVTPEDIWLESGPSSIILYDLSR